MSFIFKNADIFLPKQEIDHGKWSVVACDQYTSQPEYWKAVEEIAGDAPSTYRMILPEVYLNDPDVEKRLEGISSYMDTYLKENVMDLYENAMVYVERTDSTGALRRGIVGAIDLEAYDYHKGSTSPVRATEATVIERIPPRIRVRRSAKLELPHIMILIDDPSFTVIEPVAEEKTRTLYDFDLMQGGGHLKGALLNAKQQERVTKALEQLQQAPDYRGLLFAMGDGNHSLATAKEFYEELKRKHPGEDLSDHPARYALVEIVNLHSEALQFEAIHRILEEVDVDDLMETMKEALGLEQAADAMDRPEKCQQFTAVRFGVRTFWNITKPASKLTVGSLQNFLDAYLKEKGGKIDYIHGDSVVEKLSWQEDAIGFLLPDMAKEELFPTVVSDGALPRKTFSMGHAEDKRFYMECRRITR